MKLLFASVCLLLSANVALAKKKPLLKDGLFEGDKFTPVEDFTDEFKGSFDGDKWYNINPRWKGRQPGLFATKNVKQKRGKLFLKGRYEKPGSSAFDSAPDGYETYTTSFVQTKKNARFGYFEVRAKPGNSRLSSSFWGSLDTPTKWTEIDVFEIGGGAQNKGIDFRNRINMNLHVFRDVKKGILPGENEISKPTFYTHSSFLRSKFNTYGLDWGKKYITWTFNGRAIRRDRNRRWKQAFPIKFDVETMPNWFGLPSDKTLPATYKIKYIRAWSRKKGSKSSDDIEIAARKTIPHRFTRQVNDMFGSHFPGTGTTHNDEDEDNHKDEEDSAETEVFSLTDQETNAPVDGLQRPPIPGSNEAVYRPVTPPLGKTWTDVIEYQNSILDDLPGAEIGQDETINIADFDEELVLLATKGGPGSAAPSISQNTTQSSSPPVNPAESTQGMEKDGPLAGLNGILPTLL